MIGLLIIIYAVFIGVGLPNYLIGAAWPSMYGEMGVPNSYLGIVSMLITGGTVAASIFSGKLTRYIKEGIIVAASMFLIALAMIGFAVSDIFLVICFCAVPLGLGIGLVSAVLNNYVAVHYKPMHMNWLQGFWGVGATVGPILFSYGMAYVSSWKGGYWVIGGLLLGLVPVLAFTQSLWRKASERVKTSEITKDTTNTDDTIKLSKTVRHREEINKMKFGELLRLPGIKLSLLSFCCYSSMEATIGIWGSSYLVIVRNISPELAAQWISIYFLGLTAGRFLSGFLSIRIKMSQLVRIGCTLLAVGIVIMSLPSVPLLYLIGFFLTGLGCAPVIPCMLQNTPIQFGREYSQSVVGLQMAGAYFGAFLLPPLFGAIATYTGYGIFPLFLGALLIGLIAAIRGSKAKPEIAIEKITVKSEYRNCENSTTIYEKSEK